MRLNQQSFSFPSDNQTLELADVCGRKREKTEEEEMGAEEEDDDHGEVCVEEGKMDDEWN